MSEANSPSLQLDTKGLTLQKPHRWQQFKFDFDLPLLRDQVVDRLFKAGFDVKAEKIAACHTILFTKHCGTCKHAEKAWNHCDLSLCPICQPRISHQRQADIEWWASQVEQPKHVVLTQRNLEFLDRAAIQTLKHNWIKLRRSKFAKAWRGGCVSLEITNEGTGWHIHLHALIDARWIDSKQLAVRWAEIVGQDFAIVKVQDCRRQDYLREVCKYAVKGSDLATWKQDLLSQYILAMEHTRTFWTFGTLYKRRSEFKEIRQALLKQKRCCEKCGSSNVKWYDESEFQWYQTTCDPPTHSNPLPQNPAQETFQFYPGLQRNHWQW